MATKEQEGLLYIHSKCHPPADCQVNIYKGVITVLCGACNTPIVSFKIIVPDSFPNTCSTPGCGQDGHE